VGVIATKANNCKADEEVGFQINAVWEKPEHLRPFGESRGPRFTKQATRSANQAKLVNTRT
jgi:hypothetical protein